MNILIWYPKCSTCKNAKKYLEEKKIEFILRDIKEERLNARKLDKLINKSNLDIKSFFNTSGLVYKDLKLKDKLLTMNYQEKLNLLASNGMLVKRPIFIYNDSVLVGFKKNTWNEIIK